jgi:glycosyltransferase involved in cell wall biosynthesis
MGSIPLNIMSINFDFTEMQPVKVKFIISHPVQYFSPLFRELAQQENIDFEVWYCSDEGIRNTKDIGFDTDVKWDIPLLEGYKYRFFENKARRASIHFGFVGLWNPDILRELHREKNRVTVILHGWHYITHFIILLSARLMGHYIIFRGDNPDHHDVNLSYLKKTLKKIILIPLLNIPNLIYFVGIRNFNFFRKYGVPKEKLIYAPHSVDNKRFEMDQTEKMRRGNLLRKTYQIEENAVVIICPAKYIPKKRIHDIIDAVALTGNDRFHILLVGEGSSRTFLQNRINEKIPKQATLTGFINQSEMPDYYAMADILCLASEYGETWGLAVNEGMNCRLPVVISELCGCALDLVEHNKNGYIYPTGNIEVLSEYLNILANNKSLRHQMGENSFDRIQSFSLLKTVEGMIKGINQINMVHTESV